MDIKLTLTQRHVDALCKQYGAPEKIKADDDLDIKAESDEDYANTKINFASARIVLFVEEVAASNDLNTVFDSSRAAKLLEIAQETKATSEKL